MLTREDKAIAIAVYARLAGSLPAGFAAWTRMADSDLRDLRYGLTLARWTRTGCSRVQFLIDIVEYAAELPCRADQPPVLITTL